jgi:16S rRNA processing protein RimM
MADTSHPSGSARSAEVIVGRIIAPWGRHGELKIEALTDNPSRFAPGSVVYLGGQPARVERSRSVRGGLMIKLDTVNDRDGAESLRGRTLAVPQAEVAPLSEGSYYHFQIIDMEVWSDEGEYLGRVVEILPTGGNDVYVVRDQGNDELLIPAIADVILEVNPQENRMTVRLLDVLR